MGILACPTSSQLVQLLRGQVDNALSLALNDHIRGCPHCSDLLEQLACNMAAPSGGSAETPRGQATIGSLAENPGANFELVQADEVPCLSPARGPNEIGWLGHYRVLKVLGEGGMGMVLLAEDTQLVRPVALKVIKPKLGKDLDTRQRFLREARAMALVKSDHVVTIYQVGQENDTCYLAMELLEGAPLDKWLDQVIIPPFPETLRIGREVAQALAAAHARGLIHRDIKPANVWLEAPARRVKLLDFGLARPQQMDVKLTTTGMILGTPAYMAPEQARGMPIDGRADLFSLGCMLYEMAAGKLPFYGDSPVAMLMAVVLEAPRAPREHNPKIPASINDLILRLLAKDPADRPESAQAVIVQLQAIECALVAPDAPRSGSAQAAPTKAGFAAIKVLLVEPSRTQSGIIRTYLQNQGVQDIVVAASAQEALRAVASGPLDAIVSALHLPDMTGVQLAQQVHKDSKAAEPGFVLISSAAEKPEADAFHQCGSRVLHLQKPFTPEKLVDALKRVLPAPSATRDQLHVLIVDDSEPARLHIRNVLSGLGLTQFVEAIDGARAVAAVTGGTFHLIVTDYHMPHLDGRGLVGYLKENPATAAVPILMITTETDPAKLAAVRQLGVTVCDKSFKPEVVRGILDQLLGAP